MEKMSFEQMENVQGGDALCATAIYVAGIPTTFVATVLGGFWGGVIVGYGWAMLADYACS